MLTARTRATTALTILALGLLSASSALAAPAVTNTNDSGPGSLREAIASAAPGETVNVPPGTYTLTSGPLKLEKSLTVAGNGAGDTIVRNGAATRVFEFVKAGSVTISGMTIRDGLVLGSSAIGAGLLSVETNLTLQGANVTSNEASADGPAGGSGGGVLGAGVYSVAGSLTVLDSSISGNTGSAVGGSGKEGGSVQGAGMVVVGPLRIENSTISGNLADARGGQGASDPEQSGGVALGGGIVAVTEGGSSSIVASTVANNTTDARPGAGGAGGTSQGGGILLVSNKGPTTISKVTVAGNIARLGSSGGIGVGGGLLLVANAPGSLTLSGATIAGNTLEAPAGEANGGGNVFAVRAKFANTIVSGGVGPTGGENCGGVENESLGFNLDSANQCGFKAAGDLVNTDPLLGPLQGNGGTTETMALPPNSPAVDKGAAFGLTADQRGVQRPIDFPTIPNSSAPGADGSDIGAYELQPVSSVTLGKLKRNRKKGTATLTVEVPLPATGTLTLYGKGLKTQAKPVDGSKATFKFKVAGKAKVRKALRKRGKRKVGVNVTYAPTGNSVATAKRKVKLVKKKRKKRRGSGKSQPKRR